MPRTCKDEAPLLVDSPVVEGRYVDLDANMQAQPGHGE